MNFEALTEFYFLDLLVIICNFIAFLTTLKMRHDEDLKYIRIYIQVSMVLNFSMYTSGIFFPNSKTLSIFQRLTIALYILMELTILFFFFRKNAGQNKKLKADLSLIYFTFITLCIITFFINPRFIIDIIAAAAGIESFAIMLLCIVSLQFRIREDRLSEFIKSPDFYIFTAVLGYFSFSIPYFIGRLIIGRIDSEILPICDGVNQIFCAAYFIMIKKGLHVVPQR